MTAPPLQFGPYGGRYVAETLMPVVTELGKAWPEAWADPEFRATVHRILTEYSGRPTPLTPAPRLAEALGAKGPIFLKREDLGHTGSHKINNCVGQVLLAKRMGKTRIIAETGAGQHGVATATVAAYFGLPCVVYMGAKDVERQALNVFRMRLLGAEVRSVTAGSATLKDAINEALRDWVADPTHTHYVIGSVMGPDPYPTMVRDLQRGDRRRGAAADARPARGAARHRGRVRRRGQQTRWASSPASSTTRAWRCSESKRRARACTASTRPRWRAGRAGIYHGMKSLVLQDDHGQLQEAHSISAGLDYPGVGPEHAMLRDSGRAKYVSVTDAEALAALQQLARTEGIIVALETAHALAALPALVRRRADQTLPDQPQWAGGQGHAHRHGGDRARDGYGHHRVGGAGVKRISAAFSGARQEGRAALVGYLTAFDPDRETSRDRVLCACEAGLDVLELGVPFSDPTADGPGVAAAMVRALEAGATIDGVLELAGQVRARWDGPIVLFSYANPLVARGGDALLARAVEAGVDGLLVVDLPPEHAAELRDPALARGLDWISLVAPTTPASRIPTVASLSTGFVYAVTLKGVTGATLDADDPALAARLKTIADAASVPVAAGFGVRTPQQAAVLGRHADGVVVGSALVAAAQKGPDALAELTKALRAGLSGVRG